MTYGTIKVDTVTFTDAGVDKSVTLSGLVQNPTFSGNVTVTGTLSGVTVTGTTANFTSGNFTNISGGTHTITSGVFAAGSAASPSITFTGDLNTGIYSPGADQVAISTGGSGRLFINSSGQVGIGGSPAYMLDVTTGPFNDVARFTGFNSGTLLFRNAATDLCEIRAESGDALALGAGGSERLRITSAGLVGVGTSSPQGLFHLQQSLSDSTPILALGEGSNTVRYSIIQESGYTGFSHGNQNINLKFKTYASGGSGGTISFWTGVNSASERVTIDSSGRVGVGTTSPIYAVDIKSATDSQLRLNNSNETSHGSHDANIVAGGNYYQNPSFFGSSIKFNTYNGSSVGERLRIDSSGRVGIGTSSPGNAKLYVLGDTTNYGIQTEAPSGYGSLTFKQTSGNAISLGMISNGLFFYDNNAGLTRLTLDSSGRVGIGTTTVDDILHLKKAGDLYLRVENSSTNVIAYFGQNSSGTYIGNGATGSDIRFLPAGTERARLTTSGQLLVGTSTSRAVSDWAGNGPQGLIQIEAANSGAIMSIISAGTADAQRAGTLSLGRHRNSTVGGTPTVVQSGDALGAICFAGGDGADMLANGASIRCEVDGTPGTDDMPGRLVFSVTRDGQASPTEAARINSVGAFKATTTGSYASATNSSHEFINGNTFEEWVLRVRQTAATSNLYGLIVDFSGQTPNNATSTFIRCNDVTATRAEIRSNGGLANYSGNNVNLSDINAKKDISPAVGTWDCIKEWEIVNYRYKDQPDDADLNLGVIAQQIAESCPEVITVFEEAKDDQPEKLGVKEQQMYWMAIKALQEAQVRIEALEAEVTALKAQ